MPARYVRAYLKGQKNDFRDGKAIAEAEQRPTVNCCHQDSRQLDSRALPWFGARLVSQRTGIVGQIRAFLLDRGSRCGGAASCAQNCLAFSPPAATCCATDGACDRGTGW
jgi:hypothetical protein